EKNFSEFSLTQLVDYILGKHHNYVKENLPIIQHHLEKVSSKHGEDYPQMKKIKVLFDEIKRDFEQHIMKEEVILFPRIKVLEALFSNGELSNEQIAIEAPIHVLEFEHETAGRIMEEIKALSNNYTPP